MSLLIFSIAFIATFVSSLSGGSTSIITTPCWLSFGFSVPTVIACEKICGSFWTAIAYTNQGFFNLVLVLPAFVGATLGGYAGSALAQKININSMKILFSVIGIIFGVKLILGI